MRKSHDWEEVSFALYGKKLFPSKLQFKGEVVLAKANDPGDVGHRGRYRGKKKPYGSCEIRSTIGGRRKIVHLATYLRNHLPQYRRKGATQIVFWILWRGVQGNMEFSAVELAKLAKMKVPVAMDYIQMEV